MVGWMRRRTSWETCGVSLERVGGMEEGRKGMRQIVGKRER